MSKNPKVIGEGSYGCIHRPSLTCKNKKISYKKKVSKVLLKRHALKEMHQYLRIARADKKSHFYLGKPVECTISETKKNLDAIKGCDESDNIIENIDDYSLLVMPDGGIDIEAYVTKIKHMHKGPEMDHRLRFFWTEFLRMFEGCELFLKHNIINHDIKPQNILYDEPNRRMNFIDFGLMQSYKKVVLKSKHSDYWLGKHAHWSYPLEIQFLNKTKYDEFAKKTEGEKTNFYSKIIDNINSGKKSYNSESIKTLFSYITPRKNSKDFMNIYFNDFLHMLTIDVTNRSYSVFVRKLLDTIDLYGIGFTLLFAANSLRHLIDEPFYNELANFSYKLITPRLYERYTAAEATVKYREILRTRHGKSKTMKKNSWNIMKKSLKISSRDKRNIINRDSNTEVI